MALVSLVYASRVDPLVRSAGDVGAILESARRHNTADNITGMLAFNGYYFMQCLEGERKAVNSTFRRISADRRHTDVTLMSVRETAKRSFGSWAMGYVPDQEATRQLLLKHGESDAFDPLSIPAENLDQLLIDMSRSLSVALVGCA